MTRQKDSGESAPVDRPQLKDLHQRSVAVQVSVSGQQRLLIGQGLFEPHHPLGRVLRIQFEADPTAEIVIEEDKWTGEIVAGGPAGCDFVLRLDLSAS